MKKTFVLILAALLLLAACTSMEEKRAAHMESARKLAAEGRFADAREEAAKAAELDPVFTEAHLLIAQSFMEEDKPLEAEPHFAKVHELNPGSLEALENLCRIALINNDLDAAEEFAKKAEAIGPLSLETKISRAGIYMKRGLYEDAAAALEKLVEEAPDNEEVVVGLASAYISMKEADKGEAVLTAGLERLPDSTAILSLLLNRSLQKKDYTLATDYLDKLLVLHPEEERYVIQKADLQALGGNMDKSLEILRAWLERYPGAAKVRLHLAQILGAQGKVEEGLALLRSAPVQSGEVTLASAAMLARLGKDTEAINLLRRLTADPAQAALADEARLGIAELQLQQNNLESAERELSIALETNPQMHDARLLRGRVYFSQRRFAESIADLERVIAAQPANYNAVMTLADSYNAVGNPAKAEELLGSVITSEPRMLQAYITLANLYLLQRMPDAALMTLRIGKSSNPEDMNLPMAEAEVLTNLKRYGEAQKALEEIAKNKQYAEAALARLASVHGAAKEHGKAVGVYDRILAQNPEALFAAEGRVRAQIAQGKAKDALAWAEKREKQRPKDPSAAFMVGEAALANKNGAKAETAFLRALELAPKWDQPLGILAQMYTVSKRRDEGIKACEAILKKNPEALGISLLQGMLYEQKEYLTKAEGVYREVLAKDPDQLQAVNNLALLLTQHKPDEARLAEAENLARRIAATGSPASFDTLGWVQFLRGDVKAAEENLRKAHAGYKNNPVVAYHLAAALAVQGDKNKSAEAEAVLEGVLETQAAFPHRKEAQALLNKLKAEAAGQ